jgi:hypothetical protein
MNRGRVRRLAHALRDLLAGHPLIIVGSDGTVVDLGFLLRGIPDTDETPADRAVHRPRGLLGGDVEAR